MVKRWVVMGAVFLAVCSLAVFSQAPLILETGRVATSHDGDNWDKDDVYAQAMDWALMASFGLQKRYVHAQHSVIHSNCYSTEYHNQMIEAAKGWKHFPGFDSSIVFDTWVDIDATIAHFKVQAEKSSADNKLYFLLSGPMEVPWRSINAVSKDKRKFITCISHSTANDGMGSCAPGTNHKWADLKSSFSPDGVEFIHISDQNANLGGIGSSKWDFLLSIPTNTEPSNNIIPEEAWEWLKARDFKANGDCSDNGMLWYLLTGMTNGKYTDYKLRFESPLPMEGATHIAAHGTQRSVLSDHISASFKQNNQTLDVRVNGMQGDGSVAIYNMLSRKVSEAPLSGGQAKLALGQKSSGMFIMTIESNGQKISKEILLK